ncbi:LytTR family DNA-binding domain-containing protein [uncultured Polaribacter sp.]|uniref:LytR/AlgR family response regulator transcription factor n=1 Tax=uncultured Polaribacter sp. TaxID=174711 RepID=UPI002638DBCE|nr:LytTR family DNA-binding domain-containing protein [uncultured Polaribacter sp.]
MKKISVIIIDDETLARQRIINLLEDIPDLELMETCNTGKKAILKIDSLQPDLIFLDIQLKDMNGFDILSKIKTQKKPIVIFVSAYDEFALQAFEYFAFDYLLKPFKDQRFLHSVSKAIEYIKNNNFFSFEHKINNLLDFIQKTEPSESFHQKINKLPVKLGNKVSFLNTAEVKYILASGYYAEVFTNDKKHLLRESLSSLIKRLNHNEFVRIHRSSIVNINYISELIHSNYGEIDIKTTDGKLLRVSKGYKKEFQKLMGV